MSETVCGERMFVHGEQSPTCTLAAGHEAVLHTVGPSGVVSWTEKLCGHVTGGWRCALIAPCPRHSDGNETFLPWTALSLADARRQLTAWHFAKESPTDREREILYVAEALLRLIDEGQR